tara:strand:- start:809 stop:1144 length:336 start_codon:yes stop_codon:yes gene_type:complete
LKTNLKKNSEQIDVQSHNARISAFCEFYNLTPEEAESAIDLLDNNLGYGYTADVIALALRNETQITSQSIRLIKRGAYKNQTVFDFLLEVAATNKSDGKKAQNSIKQKLTL